MGYWKLWIRTTYSNGMTGGAGVSTDVIEFKERREADEAYNSLKADAEENRYCINVVKLYKDL